MARGAKRAKAAKPNLEEHGKNRSGEPRTSDASLQFRPRTTTLDSTYTELKTSGNREEQPVLPEKTEPMLKQHANRTEAVLSKLLFYQKRTNKTTLETTAAQRATFKLTEPPQFLTNPLDS